MRNLLWSMLCIAAILTSCTEPSADVDNIVAGEDFTATITESRAELNGVAVQWNEADELTIFTKTAHNRHYRVKSLSNGNRTATFGYVSYSGNDNTPILSNYALYPYDADATLSGEIITTKINAEQVYNAEKVDLANALMVAKSTSTALQFVNATSLMRFEVSNNMPDSYTLSSIKLVSAANKLAGEVSIDLSTDCKAVVTENGQNEVTLSGINCEITAEKQSFYVALPATTFAAKDLTVTFTYTEGVEKSFQLPAFELALGSIKTINYTINDGEDFNGETPKPNANDVIHYTATAKVEAHSNFPWSFDTFGANIVSNEWDSESGKGIITFDADVTTIGGSAFEDCDSLTSITIPDSITTIEYVAFVYCTNLVEFNGKFASEDGRCLIVDGTLNSFAPAGLTSYTIPDSVTTIGDYAFADCNSLISITIPDSVTTIGYRAFFTCDSLTSITIPDGVTTIGGSAFNWCDSLTSVTIPDSVTIIEAYAFSNCSSLTSVYCEATTPPSLGGGDVFDDNASGRKIYVPAASVEAYKSAEGWSEYADAIIAYDFENGVVVEPEVSINNVIHYTATAKVEMDWTFDTFGANIVSHEWNSETDEGIITFDADVTTIGKYAFKDCLNLTGITIPDSVTTIGEGAFYLCRYLTGITIPNSVTTIGEMAFTSCSSLTNITIPDSVTTIENQTFYDCESLINITIPDSVTSIGFQTFYGCSDLTSISIPDSVTTIGNEAFACCQSLTEFNGELASEDGRCLIIDGTLSAFAPTGLTSYTIPDSVTTIGGFAFAECYSLTSVTIPDSVTTIGECAFLNCGSLTSVTIPDSVTTIGNRAFHSCDSLTSITIPDGVTTIELYTFSNCDSLTSITIPDSVTTIEDCAFYDCSKLASITIPNSVTTIGASAFHYCSNLTSITIPNSVTTIGDGAFYYCSNLTSITIPNSVTTIGNEAFDLCRSLASVYCEATTPPSLGSYAFSRNASGRTIYVPDESVRQYEIAEGWSEYTDAIVGYDF